ncbi:PBP1A family penicillin-binding protein [Burkholderia gladioli]|uniref:penicillin-binding protein 1A n=1 Tax=Burkholderia gladioli TaxID=28095 RepID=UPI001C23416F|nr:PBP1A family penicillin-binding protein [Burkholderia gladioli]MBU9195342.1 PBP1A family penicillin-binding protein [Burkholderia gladioli]
MFLRKPDPSTAPSSEPPGQPGGDRAPRRRGGWRRLRTALVGLVCAGVVAGASTLAYLAWVVYPSLPPVSALGDYQPAEPLRIFSSDGELLAEYGIERRIPLEAGAIPLRARQALLAAEDASFYAHPGVDAGGLLRAVFVDALRGGKAQGGSTITMQLARNFFLSRHKTFARKLYEVLLAIKLERSLPKDRILQLYMNQIYLGERSYGFGAAARTYYGRDLGELTIAQTAMLAGLPKAPSAYNPISDPERAQARQRYVLARMREVGYLSPAEYRAALDEPPYQRPEPRRDSVPAGSVSELVRQMMVERYGEAAYESGFRVTTTVALGEQRAAFEAVRHGAEAYQQRHGYAGPEASVAAPVLVDGQLSEAVAQALKQRPEVGGMASAVVIGAGAGRLDLMRADGERVALSGRALAVLSSGAGRRVVLPSSLKPGAIVRIARDGDGDGRWMLRQLPAVQAALVAISPDDGAIRALVGGNGYTPSQLNHVTQAWRQPGSSFKPFIYSAALAKGFAPASVIDDLPLEIPASYPGGPVWRPRESGALLGPIALREGLARSKNLVAVRVLRAIEPAYAKDYIVRAFGLRSDLIVPNLPMALGAGALTPLQMATGYASFANGGFRVQPYLIAKIQDGAGQVLFEAAPARAGAGAPRVISAANSYLMTDMLRRAAMHGTGAATNALKRGDLAGKTGTTNNYRDGWFAGYQRQLATVVWMGFDTPASMGPREYGARNALPVWIEFMGHALAGVPESIEAPPEDIALIDGEPYDKAFLPGQGFVAALDAQGAIPLMAQRAGGEAGAIAAVAASGPVAAHADARAASTPGVVSSDEKARILRYFAAPSEAGDGEGM